VSRRTIAFAAALAAGAAPALAAADEPETDAPAPALAEADELVVKEQAKEAPATPAHAPRRQYVSLGFGIRAAHIESKGYDPYSESDGQPMMTLFGTVTPWPTRPFSVHLAFEWDYGSSESHARGIESTLDLHRLALGLELRYLPISRISLFARAMPAAIHAGGVVKDASFTDHLEANAWTWGVDATAGAAARVASFGHVEHPAASIWIGLDMGYRFAAPAAMRLRPGGLTEADQARRFGEVPMADLDVSGFVGRLTGSVSF
jgi:hypothetical protein